MRAGWSIFVVLVAAALIAAAPAAAEVHVTSSADSGAGSLREAIEVAAPGETVTIDPGVNPVLSTEIKIDKSLTIRGQGASATTISGGGVTRVFNVGSVTPGIAVRIEGLGVAEGRASDGANGAPEPASTPAGNGSPGGGGGAIRNSANQLELVNVALTKNVAGNGGTGGMGISLPPGVGGAGGSGGAVSNSGTATITGSTLSGNRAGMGGAGGTSISFFFPTPGSAGGGGAVANSGTLTMSNSTLADNEAGSGAVGGSFTGIGMSGSGGGNGGAVINTGLLTVTGSTLEDNAAGSGGLGGFGPTVAGPGGSGGNGGGIFAEGTARIENSTFVENSAGSGGAGVPSSSLGGAGGAGGNGGAVVAAGVSVVGIAGATFAENAPGAGGPGGIGATVSGANGSAGSGGALSGVLTVRGSILAANTGTNPNCNAGVVDAGGNVAFPEAGGCVGPAVADPKLDPAGLANNGGPTQTIALLAGSAAIDAVPTGACLNASGTPLSVDQRGVGRPQGAACDAGAFEVAVPTTHVDPGVTVPNTKIAGKAKRKVRTAKKRARVKVAFSSIPAGAGFECKLDRKPFRPCTSPKAYRLKPGRHAIEVRAVLNGVADPTPARVSIKVIEFQRP